MKTSSKKYPSINSAEGVMFILKNGRKPNQQKILDKTRPARLPGQIPQQWPRQ
jgi:uncharacterized protein YneF (UPF0154 family)